MNEKKDKILELTDLLEEDFEEMDGVEDFAPEEPFDASELDTELDLLLDEQGKGGGVKDDDIDLDALFDEEDESGGLIEEAAEDSKQDGRPARKSSEVEELSEFVDDSDNILDLDLSEDLEPDFSSNEDPLTAFDELEDVSAEEEAMPLLDVQNDKDFEKEDREASSAQETDLSSTEGEAVENQQAETIAALQQELSGLQANVTALQAQLAELNTGLQEKERVDKEIKEQEIKIVEAVATVQTLQEQFSSLDGRVQQVEGFDGRLQQLEQQDNAEVTTAVQTLQEQFSSLDGRVQQVESFDGRLQQLEQQESQDHSETLAEIQQGQEALKARLADLEAAGAEDKVDVEALRANLKEFITNEIPAVVAGMLREEIEALAKQIGH